MSMLIEQLEHLLSDIGPLEVLFEDRILPPYSSPAGKMRMAKTMINVIPDHNVYVEPFAGSAAVLFAKPKVEVEVLNDLDPEVADALKTLSGMSQADLERLLKKSWHGDEATYKRLHATKFSDRLDRLHRFLYLAKMAFGSIRGPSNFCAREATRDHQKYFDRRLPPAVERMSGVKVYNEDYEKVCRKYDSKETFFFLDPPYAGYSALDAQSKATGEGSFDEKRFFDMLMSLKGKWFLNYGERGELPGMLKEAGVQTRIVHKARDFRHILKKGGDKDGPTTVGHLLASNYGAQLGRVK
jgi:DNA adenine methylase